MTARYLQVLVEVPADVPISEAREYIQSELKDAGGCRHLEDPLFKGLKVTKIRRGRP